MAREQWTVFAYLCDGDNGNCIVISDSDDDPYTAKAMAEDKGWYIDADGERDAMALCPKHRHEYDNPPTTAVIGGGGQ